MSQSTQNELENIVDRVGIEKLLIALSDVCAEKAEHVRTNWQDQKLATLWDRASKVVRVAANRPCVLDLP